VLKSGILKRDRTGEEEKGSVLSKHITEQRVGEREKNPE
jgi:hypothetical protein